MVLSIIPFWTSHSTAMSCLAPEILWQLMELHDSVSLCLVESRARQGALARQGQGFGQEESEHWTLPPTPQRSSPLDEHNLLHASWNGCLEQVKALLIRGVKADCR